MHPPELYIKSLDLHPHQVASLSILPFLLPTPFAEAIYQSNETRVANCKIGIRYNGISREKGGKVESKRIDPAFVRISKVL